MAKRFVSFFVVVMSGSALYAQPPNFNNYYVDKFAGVNSFDYNCSDWEKLTGKCSEIHNHLKSEIPPWIIGGGGEWRSYFTTDGSKSYVTSIEKDLVSNDFINIDEGGVGPTETSSTSGCLPAIAVPADLEVNSNSVGYSKATNSVTLSDGFEADAAAAGDYMAAIVNGLLAGQDWRRSYYNIYSAHFVDYPGVGPISLGFLHAENKAGCNCPSTITPDQPEYGDGYNCNYVGDYWPTMGKFVCAKWINNDGSTNYGQGYFNNDVGPIVWPSNGYVMNDSKGLKISAGTSEPSSIIYDNYVYVFYVDHGPFAVSNAYSVPQEEGRAEGVKVVRAPVSQALDPSAWRAYYKDPNGNVSWNPALPNGFDKNNMDLFWGEKGPKATDLMGDEFNNQFESHRFSVAKANNSPYFVGIESYMNNDGSWGFALRYSLDLVNWSGRTVIDNNAGWGDVEIGYPVFLDFAGWTNTEIDINNFFVMGKKATASGAFDQYFHKYHIYNTAARMATNTTTASPKLNSANTGIMPTPNTGSFRLSYQLTGHANVQINVFDVMGRQVYTITPGTKGPGTYVENINIGSQAKGMYLVELVVDGKKQLFKTIKD